MAANPKPGAPPPSRRGEPAPSPPPPPSAAAPDRSRPVRTVFRSALKEKSPYVRLAFSNPYNLSLFLGTMAASVLTMNPILAMLALGGEAVWMLNAPGSKLLQRLLWDKRLAEMRADEQLQQRASRLMGASEDERRRVEELVTRQVEIRRLAEQNPSFTADLLRTELAKTDRLVDAFIDMAVTCTRYEQYLGSVDFDALDEDRTRWDRVVKGGATDDPHVEIAKKNLEIILRRLDKMKEIRRYLSVARGQLDLIENSFQLLADQIVTMQSPQQLSGQLDELLDGVEAIRETTADTERMLTSIGIETSTP